MSGVYGSRVLKTKEVGGRVMYLVQWEPTLEVDGLKQYGYGKYVPKGISRTLFEENGEKKRMVSWYPTWEEEEVLVVEDIGHSKGRNTVQRGSVKTRVEGLADGWEVRRTGSYSVPVYLHTLSGRCSLEPPDGTTFAAASFIAKEQRRILCKAGRKALALRRRRES